MIAASRLVLVVAICVAASIHFLAVLGFLRADDVQIEGDAGGVEASLGNSFADFVAGAAVPEEALETTEPTEARDQTTPIEPDRIVEEPEPVDQLQQDPPPETPQTAPAPTVTATSTDADAVAAVVPSEPLQTVDANVVPLTAPDQIESSEVLEQDTSAVSRSLRPQPRSSEFEERHKPPPQPRQVVTQQPRQQPRQQAQPQPRGNAAENAVTGSATGTQTRQSQAATGTGTTSRAGNAAISNYPGLVMRRLSRVSRPRVGVRGTAVISFRVGPSGGLASASVARSSGSADLDRAALSMVRRAAPFPPPPPGAQRSFSINIQGR